MPKAQAPFCLVGTVKFELRHHSASGRGWTSHCEGGGRGGVEPPQPKAISQTAGPRSQMRWAGGDHVWNPRNEGNEESHQVPCFDEGLL